MVHFLPVLCDLYVLTKVKFASTDFEISETVLNPRSF